MRLEEDYSDRGFRNRFMAKSPDERDDLEDAFIDGGVKEMAAKLLRQLDAEPAEFRRKVVYEIANRMLAQ